MKELVGFMGSITLVGSAFDVVSRVIWLVAGAVGLGAAGKKPADENATGPGVAHARAGLLCIVFGAALSLCGTAFSHLAWYGYYGSYRVPGLGVSVALLLVPRIVEAVGLVLLAKATGELLKALAASEARESDSAEP